MSMKTIIRLLPIILFYLISCCQNKQMTEIKIMPLHPYSASPTDYEKTTPAEESFVAKFYFIQGACEATDQLSNGVDSFLSESLRKDEKDFDRYGGYYIYFYRQTKDINKNFRQQIDGIFSNSLDAYTKDLLFEYEWSYKKFSGCYFYKNGKIIKTVRNKKGDLFKRTLFHPKGYTDKMEVGEIPELDSKQKR